MKFRRKLPLKSGVLFDSQFGRMDLLAPGFSKREEPMVEGGQWWTADTEEAAQSEQGKRGKGKSRTRLASQITTRLK